ncbi:MAG: hypothetical protein K0S33_2958 [Bacteroidetes bacterium]|jgi:hypothetical protein|nr:hypothetical protein [Bacteroidota bacterium]
MKVFKLMALCLTLGATAFAQNFNKETISAHTNFGIEIYDVKYTQHININGVSENRQTTDKAANRNFSFGGDYAVIKKLALGLRVKLNTYYTSGDSSNGTAAATAKSQDYMLTANYHLVDKKIFNLSAGLGVGGSHLYYNDNIKLASNNNEGNIIRGNGPYFQFQLSPQFVIAKRVGVGMSFYTPFVNYSKMKSNDELANIFVISKWKGSGYGFSFNLNFIIVKGE